MKKLLFILALCLSVFASAQCGSTLNQSARWKFLYSQCFQDTLTMQYVDTSKIAYFDSYGNLTTITYAALLDSLAIEETTYPDSSVLFVGNNGRPTTDSLNFIWDDGTNSLRIGAPNYTFLSGAFQLARLTSFALNQSSATWTNYLATNSPTVTANYPLYTLIKTRGTVVAPTSLSGIDEARSIGGIRFGSYDGVSYITSSSEIKASSPRNWAVGQTPSYFEFWTTPSNSTTAVRSVFFTHTGGIAIGSNWADTTFNLTVNGTAAITQTPVFQNGKDSVLVHDNTTGQIMNTPFASLLDTITAPSVTGSSAFSGFRINQTWNTSGNPSAILLNITNTASGATSKFIDLQIASTSQWAVNKNGTILGNGNGGVADFTSPLGALCFRVRGVGRENNNLTFEIQAGRAHSSSTGVEVLSGSTFTGTSGTQRGLDILPTFVPSAAGSMSLNMTSLRYTINGAAGAQTGTVTGLFLDATETSLNGATHNLMDLRVGGSNRFLVTRTGATTIGSVLTLTPMTSATASALTPAFGMLVVVNDTNGTFTSTGLWFYDSAAWVKLN